MNRPGDRPTKAAPPPNLLIPFSLDVLSFPSKLEREEQGGDHNLPPPAFFSRPSAPLFDFPRGIQLITRQKKGLSTPFVISNSRDRCTFQQKRDEKAGSDRRTTVVVLSFLLRSSFLGFLAFLLVPRATEVESGGRTHPHLRVREFEREIFISFLSFTHTLPHPQKKRTGASPRGHLSKKTSPVSPYLKENLHRPGLAPAVRAKLNSLLYKFSSCLQGK